MFMVLNAVFSLLLGGLLLIPLLLAVRRSKRSESPKPAAEQPSPDAPKKPSLQSVEYRRPQLDTRGLEKLNRDLEKLYANRDKSTKWVLIWGGVIVAALLLGIVTGNDMVFNIGMLIGIVGMFSFIIGSTIGFQRLLSRTKKQFWGDMASRLLQETFSKYGAEVTGNAKRRSLSGSFSLENEKYQVQVQFGASEEYERGRRNKDSYYNILSSMSMRIVPANHPAPYMDLRLVPDHGSTMVRLVQKGGEALSNAISGLTGNGNSQEEVVFEDPEFGSRFRALSSQPAAAAAFLTADQRHAIVELSRCMGRAEIRYREGMILVKWYGFQPAGYAYMSHTGLPSSFTENHLASLLHDVETALLNLPALWQPLPENTDSTNV